MFCCLSRISRCLWSIMDEKQIMHESAKDGGLTQVGPEEIRPQTYDGYSVLHTQQSKYLNGEPSTLKIPHSGTCSCVWSFKCGVLSNRHKFWARPQT